MPSPACNLSVNAFPTMHAAPIKCGSVPTFATPGVELVTNTSPLLTTPTTLTGTRPLSATALTNCPDCPEFIKYAGSVETTPAT